MRAPVLLAHYGPAVLEYLVPEGVKPGAVVSVPLGPRRVRGVVWDEGVFAIPSVDAAKLKPVAAVLDLPPIGKSLRQLVKWTADYYMASPAVVLRMVLPQEAFMAPPKPVSRYRMGAIPPVIRGEARQALVGQMVAMEDFGPATLKEWAEATDATVSRLGALVQAGILEEIEPAANQPKAWPPVPAGPQLGEAQQAAADILRPTVQDRKFRPFLLDGVTGSGKTETCFEGVAAAIADGGQALVLLPEIALTESWLARFKTRFGFAPTAWHSGLTPATRRQAFAAIANGDARVTVGARSALFLPFPDLRLIIVDEAHDQAFKQEDGVCYHGRDVAVMRAHFAEIPVVLSTATPALETVEQVRRGTYQLLSLPQRHGVARMPDIHLINMVKTPPPRGKWIAPPLAGALEDRLGRGEQSLLFLNRRGYAPLTLCRACGERIQCPDCTAWLVEHRHAGKLQCHHCGHSVPTPKACPACGAEDMLAPCGPGVERLAEEVMARWPAARVQVVTSDTLRTSADAAALTEAVEDGAVDILIGTQVLAKGHDFPKLTLVGVIDADLGLSGGDLRAGERTFQQIAQVAGRAGRGALPGEVFIQTHQPQAPVMQALQREDRAGFLEAEREARLAAGMPPFGRLAALILSSVDAGAVADVARRLAAAAPVAAGIDVWGPSPAPLAMLRGRHRHRLLVHAGRTSPLQDYLRQWLAGVELPANVRLAIDIDPQSFL
ncbi:MAG: primosomal protein N' [Sphingomonadaceae bacterium]